MAALPEVQGKGRPLQFRQWWPGVAMVPGALGIPAPVDTDLVVPDAAFVPLVGFDGAGYRLGYGGGYFDRTLAALARKPLTVGVGTEAARLPTIHPQPHDVPMDFIVTEAGVHAVVDGTLVAMPVAARSRRDAAAPDGTRARAPDRGRVASATAVLGAQHVLLHLAHGVARQVGDEDARASAA